jgi:hypothetical protein
MSGMISFTKYEKEIIHHYREALIEAKRIDDVANTFIDTVFKLFKTIVPDLPDNYIEYVGFAPEANKKYIIDNPLKEYLEDLFEKSDLESIVERLVEMAYNRYKHLVHEKEQKNYSDVFFRKQ